MGGPPVRPHLHMALPHPAPACLLGGAGAEHVCVGRGHIQSYATDPLMLRIHRRTCSDVVFTVHSLRSVRHDATCTAESADVSQHGDHRGSLTSH